jgi:hypothetical protein
MWHVKGLLPKIDHRDTNKFAKTDSLNGRKQPGMAAIKDNEPTENAREFKND